MSSDGLPNARGVLRRRGDALQVVEPLHLLRRAAGHEQRREHLAERRILLAPALPHQGEHRVGLLDLRLRAALAPPARKAAVEHEMADALGMAHRIGDGNRAALRDAEQRETARARSLRPRSRDRARRRRTRCRRRPSRTGRCRARRSGSAGARRRARAAGGLQIGLSQSYSRWLSQLALLTSGGPLPTRRRRCARRRTRCRNGSPAAAALGAGWRSLRPPPLRVARWLIDRADEADALARDGADQPLLARRCRRPPCAPR